MATLREAVESGRRWRHKDWDSFPGIKKTWSGPGPVHDNGGSEVTIDEALSSDFEIEPKPFIPSFDAADWAREFVRIVKDVNPAIPTDEGAMVGWFANALMRGFDEANTRNLVPPNPKPPEPEKPREWELKPGGVWVGPHITTHTRTHDADACDRLKRTVTVSEYEFVKIVESFEKWRFQGPGAQLQFYFGLDNLNFNIRRGE